MFSIGSLLPHLHRQRTILISALLVGFGVLSITSKTTSSARDAELLCLLLASGTLTDVVIQLLIFVINLIHLTSQFFTFTSGWLYSKIVQRLLTQETSLSSDLSPSLLDRWTTTTESPSEEFWDTWTVSDSDEDDTFENGTSNSGQ